MVLLVVQTALIASHRVRWHRRLGVLGTAWAVLLVVIGAFTTLHAPDALARLPVSFMTGGTEVDLNLRIMLGLDLFIVICVGLDTLWHRRLHPAFGWGALLFVCAFHAALYLAQKPAWIAFGESLVS